MRRQTMIETEVPPRNEQMRRRTRFIAAVALAPLLWCSKSVARAAPCPLEGQKPMIVAQLFFGQAAGRSAASSAAWRNFLRDTVTPRFPEGFTVYDAYGQWYDAGRQEIIREQSKVVVVAIDAQVPIAAKITGISRIYRRRFHQRSVGIVTSTGCGQF